MAGEVFGGWVGGDGGLLRNSARIALRVSRLRATRMTVTAWARAKFQAMARPISHEDGAASLAEFMAPRGDGIAR